MPPAARLTDPHTDPHGGGPITGPGEPTVLIGGKISARKTDRATCKRPLDTIIEGEDSVLIGGKPAARVGDGTAHGGVVVKGESTVLIGKPRPKKASPKKSTKKDEKKGEKKDGDKKDEKKDGDKKEGEKKDGDKRETRRNPEGWNRERSLESLRNRAEDGYTGNCGRYVRTALQDGGIPWGNGPGGNPGAAADFGPELERHGFDSVASGTVTGRGTPGGYDPQAGDVMVFDRVPGHSAGHVAMYDGSSWISDTNQGRDPVSSNGYVRNGGGYTVYRRN